MSGITHEIIQWANQKLPFWEQVALDKILAGEALSDGEYNDLLHLLLEDHGLADEQKNRPKLRFNEFSQADDSITSQGIRLEKIYNMQNVNALVGEQSLPFSPSLTIIYGETGSGKSGYARVLGCAGFTRGDHEVLPDVTLSCDNETLICAEIQISSNGEKKDIHYSIGEQCPELSAFYVFDSTSVRVHLSDRNKINFSPSSLNCLKQLSHETDKVREILRTKIEELTKPHTFNPLFPGESKISALIEKINVESDLKELKNLGTLSKTEVEQKEAVETEIAKLKIAAISKQITTLTQQKTDMENLSQLLQGADEKLNDEALSDIDKLRQRYLETKSKTEKISVNQFKSKHFSQIGTEPWHKFVQAAKELSEKERPPEEKYPKPDDHCLLCHQPLSKEAYELLLKLWEFLEGEAQKQLKEIETTIRKRRRQLGDIDLDFFTDQMVSFRYLSENNSQLQQQITDFIESCVERRKAALDMLDGQEKRALPKIRQNRASEIDAIIKTLGEKINELEKKDQSKELAEKEKQLLHFQHREILGKHYDKIKTYIEGLTWAKKATEIIGDTAPITRKHNELFSKIVTDRYLEHFRETLSSLIHPLKVKLKTTGMKSESYKQIMLETDPQAYIEGANPETVLSEGEKRAVALSDFLTEVALDSESKGIILDDPVTSFDFQRREKIAALLVEEAKKRQVIVFTHDLPFLYFLKKYSDDMAVEMANHWIKRGEYDDKPGYVFIDNSPALERGYRSSKEAQRLYKLAKEAKPQEQEILLKQGFGALRTSYEAFVIFELFNEVVMRFEERISFGRLKEIVWDKEIADEIIRKCELLSRYIEGHLHSDAFGSEKPTPDILIKEIEAFNNLKNKLKKAKK